jgi:uncharacterized membrane protein YedE/YeeE
MSLPITGTIALVLAVVFGAVFGFLLQRGRVTYYDVIVNQFRFKDFTVLKVMLTAVLVGGIGVWLLHGAGLAQFHIKSADLLGVSLGAAIFGIGMVLYGYCPGTGVAAVGQGSIHALIGFIGMLLGGILYALSFSWVKANILSVASLGKVRLPDLTGVPDAVWYVALAVLVPVVFVLVERYERRAL